MKANIKIYQKGGPESHRGTPGSLNGSKGAQRVAQREHRACQGARRRAKKHKFWETVNLIQGFIWPNAFSNCSPWCRNPRGILFLFPSASIAKTWFGYQKHNGSKGEKKEVYPRRAEVHPRRNEDENEIKNNNNK